MEEQQTETGKVSKKEEQEILSTARTQYQKAVEYERDERDLQLDDLKFAEGGENQWEPKVFKIRTAAGKPCITINSIPSFLDQIEGDQRQANMAIKVRPVGNAAEKETARIFSGMIKNIEYQSNSKIIYQTGANSAALCGRGHWRILTQWSDDDSFEQEIILARVTDTFAVVCDPEAKKFDKSDAKWQFITADITRETFKTRWPKKEPMTFDTTAGSAKTAWASEDTVKIAEYFRKIPSKRTLLKIQGPAVEDPKTQQKVQPPAISEWEDEFNEEWIEKGFKVIDSREVDIDKVEYRLIDGSQTLAGPIIWLGKYIPIIEVVGKEMFVGSRRVAKGIVRDAKDPARLYNYSRSINAETLSLAPKVPYFVTPAQIKGHENQWKTAHQQNYIYLLYNPDPKSPGGKPYREPPLQISGASMSEIELSRQDLKNTIGLHNASLGARSNETSGKAILAREQSGDTGKYAYTDNLSMAIQYTGKQLVDLIPKIYDTARMVTLLNLDDSEEQVAINTAIGGGKMVNDITVGKYDVVVTVGPSYTTQRVEAAESLMAFADKFPESRQIIQDLVAKNLDAEGSDVIAERLRKLVPKNLLEEEGENGEEGQQQEPPSPEEQAEQQQQEQQQQAAQLELEKKQLEVEQEKAKLEGLRLENQKKEAEIEQTEVKTAATAIGNK